MHIKDRFTIGFIAGVIGGVVMNAGDYITLTLGVCKRLFIDWSSVFIFGEKTDALSETMVALFGQLIFSGMVGIIFAYLIVGATSKYLYFKGCIFALLVWFISYAVVVLFNINLLIPTGITTVVSNIVNVSIYGLVLAFVHKKLYFAAGDGLQDTD